MGLEKMERRGSREIVRGDISDPWYVLDERGKLC